MQTEKEKTISLADANAAIDRIAEDRSRITTRRTELHVRLESLEATAGLNYLEGDTSAVREIAEVRAELDLIERALAALDQRESAARLALKAATAADLRRQADEKRREL